MYVYDCVFRTPSSYIKMYWWIQIFHRSQSKNEERSGDNIILQYWESFRTKTSEQRSSLKVVASLKRK